ncbi:hypothetical protein AGIG_G9674 [Arapaima gigas]
MENPLTAGGGLSEREKERERERERPWCTAVPTDYGYHPLRRSRQQSCCVPESELLPTVWAVATTLPPCPTASTREAREKNLCLGMKTSCRGGIDSATRVDLTDGWISRLSLSTFFPIPATEENTREQMFQNVEERVE